MDLSQLIDQVGLWPALVLVLVWQVDKIRKEQIAERDARIKTLDDEARRTVAAKDAELAEWKRRALDGGGPRP